MFCSGCGYEVKDGARFCSACGVSLEKEKSVETKAGLPDFSVRPSFSSMLSFLRILPIALFFSLWGAALLGAVYMGGMNLLEKQIEQTYLPFLYGGILTFVLFMIYPFYSKKSYQGTSYDFYGDELEYREGALTQETKNLKYSKIIGVNLTKGILQRIFHRGSVYIETMSDRSFFPIPMTGPRRGWASGILIKDVDNPDDVYLKIKQKVLKS